MDTCFVSEKLILISHQGGIDDVSSELQRLQQLAAQLRSLALASPVKLPDQTGVQKTI